MGSDGSAPEGLLEVGRIGRPYGIRGDVFVDLTTDRTERVAVGARLWARDRWMRVTASSPSNRRWRVHFEGIDTREDAQVLTGTLLRAEPIEDPDALWVHELIGAVVATPDGREWGTVATVLDNPADDLLELDDGTLVPVGFVVDGTGLPARVVVDPPAGLLGGDEDDG